RDGGPQLVGERLGEAVLGHERELEQAGAETATEDLLVAQGLGELLPGQPVALYEELTELLHRWGANCGAARGCSLRKRAVRTASRDARRIAEACARPASAAAVQSAHRRQEAGWQRERSSASSTSRSGARRSAPSCGPGWSPSSPWPTSCWSIRRCWRRRGCLPATWCSPRQWERRSARSGWRSSPTTRSPWRPGWVATPTSPASWWAA